MTLTATIGVLSPGAGVPTGTVNFYDGTTLLGTSTLGNSNGVATATFAITSLAVRTHSITAQYSGDTNDLNSSSGGLAVTISRSSVRTRRRKGTGSIPMAAQATK